MIVVHVVILVMMFLVVDCIRMNVGVWIRVMGCQVVTTPKIVVIICQRGSKLDAEKEEKRL